MSSSVVKRFESNRKRELQLEKPLGQQVYYSLQLQLLFAKLGSPHTVLPAFP